MIKKYHNHKLQTNLCHCEEDHTTITRHQEDKQSEATSSLFPIKMIAKLEKLSYLASVICTKRRFKRGSVIIHKQIGKVKHSVLTRKVSDTISNFQLEKKPIVRKTAFGIHVRQLLF